MPKPTEKAVYDAISAGIAERVEPPTSQATSNVMVLINASWAEYATERERGRKAIEIIEKHGIRHADYCGWRQGLLCSCGKREAEAAFYSDAPSSSEDEDMEQWNRDQRIRREAYEEALKHQSLAVPQERARIAATRYPLKKRVPKVIPDSHGDMVWRAVVDVELPYLEAVEVSFYGGKEGSWRSPTTPSQSVLFSRARILALAELLKDPWTIEEDTNPDETT